MEEANQNPEQQLSECLEKNGDGCSCEHEFPHAQRWVEETASNIDRWEQNIASILEANPIPTMAKFVATVNDPIDLTTTSSTGSTFNLQPLIPVLPTTMYGEQQQHSPSSTSSTIPQAEPPCINLTTPIVQELNAAEINAAINSNMEEITVEMQKLIRSMVYHGYLHRRLCTLSYNTAFTIFPPPHKILEDQAKTTITAGVCAVISRISPLNGAYLMRRLIGEPRYYTTQPYQPSNQQQEEDGMISDGEDESVITTSSEEESEVEEDIPDGLASFAEEARLEEQRAQQFWRYTPLSIRTATDWECQNVICLFCQYSIKWGQDVIEFPVCGHVYCAHELLKWLQAHTRCPFCREERPTKPLLIPDNSRNILLDMLMEN